MTVGITSSLAYDAWFGTAHSTFRTAVLGLVVGTVFLPDAGVACGGGVTVRAAVSGPVRNNTSCDVLRKVCSI